MNSATKVTSLSLRLVPSARNPFAHAVSGCEANDQSDYNFHFAIGEPKCDDSEPTDLREHDKCSQRRRPHKRKNPVGVTGGVLMGWVQHKRKRAVTSAQAAVSAPAHLANSGRCAPRRFRKAACDRTQARRREALTRGCRVGVRN